MWKPNPWGVVKPKTSKVVENSSQIVHPPKNSPPRELKKEIWNEIASERNLADTTSESDDYNRRTPVEHTVGDALGVRWKSSKSSSGMYTSEDASLSPVLSRDITPSLNSSNDLKLGSSPPSHYNTANTLHHHRHSKKPSYTNLSPSEPVVVDSQELYDSGNRLVGSSGEKSTGVLRQQDLLQKPLVSQLAGMQKLLEVESEGVEKANDWKAADNEDRSTGLNRPDDEAESTTETESDSAYESDSETDEVSARKQRRTPPSSATKLHANNPTSDENYVNFPGSTMQQTKSAPAALPQLRAMQQVQTAPASLQQHQHQQKFPSKSKAYRQTSSPIVEVPWSFESGSSSSSQEQQQQQQHPSKEQIGTKEQWESDNRQSDAIRADAAEKVQTWFRQRQDERKASREVEDVQDQKHKRKQEVRLKSVVAAEEEKEGTPEKARGMAGSHSASSPPTSLPFEFDEDLLIERDEIELVAKIGEGFFGEVWRAKWNVSQDVACKKMKHEVTSAGDRNTLLSEVASLSKLRHPNITVFYGVTNPPDAIIVCELLKSSLFQLIHQTGTQTVGASVKKTLPLAVIVRILRDVASGGAYLHRRRPPVIHRDLSSSNVLLSVPATASEEELELACLDESKPIAKLTDFGLSRNVGWYMTSCVGNLFYLAPEVFSGDHYTESADVFSFGIMTWELVTRRSPFEGQNPQRAAFLAATKHVRPSQSIDVLDESPPALASLRDRCWHKDPLERPAFSVALSELGDIDVTPQGSSSGTGRKNDMSRHSFVSGTEHAYAQFSHAPLRASSNGSRDRGQSQGEWNWRRRTLNDLLQSRWALPLLLDRKILWNEDLEIMGLTSATESIRTLNTPKDVVGDSDGDDTMTPESATSSKRVAKGSKSNKSEHAGAPPKVSGGSSWGMGKSLFEGLYGKEKKANSKKAAPSSKKKASSAPQAPSALNTTKSSVVSTEKSIPSTATPSVGPVSSKNSSSSSGRKMGNKKAMNY